MNAQIPRMMPMGAAAKKAVRQPNRLSIMPPMA